MTRFDPRLSAHGPADLPRQARPETPTESGATDGFRLQLGSESIGASAPTLEPRGPATARSVHTLMRDGLARGAERREVLDKLVEARWRERFGCAPAPELVARVSEQLAGDPQITGLYGRLAGALELDGGTMGGAR